MLLNTMSFRNQIYLRTTAMGASQIYPSVTSCAMPPGTWKSAYHRDGWKMGHHLDITVILV